jgi:hypothetical protein
MDTNQRDYAHVEEDTATSLAPDGSCARDAQAWGQQKYRLLSPTTLTREIPQGNDEARMSNVELMTMKPGNVRFVIRA